MPKLMLILGLTGGSGVGKTTVLQVWAGQGAYPIVADEIYHRLLREDTALLDRLRVHFPEAFTSGALDRKALGRVVFASPERQKELEGLTHGAVIAEVERELDVGRLQGCKAAVVDALYLLENPLREIFAAIVGVVAPLEERIARIAARDGVSRAYAAARVAAQPDDAYYRSRCDIILENDAGPEQLACRAKTIFSEILRSAE